MLTSSEMFWLSTVRADGRPHVTPLPAVWLNGALPICTGDKEQKSVNLRHTADCVLTTGTPFQVMDDGTFDDGDGSHGTASVYGIAPSKILAFAKDPYVQTRFRF